MTGFYCGFGGVAVLVLSAFLFRGVGRERGGQR